MIRIAALGAPVLLFCYGVLRLIDGLDGDHGPGLAWNVGHAMFLVAIGLFATVMVGLHRVTRASGPRLLADSFLTVGLVGAACFVIVIAGDLFDAVDDLVELPDAVMLLGPVAFLAGLVGPLVRLASARQVAWWSPALAVAGFAVFSANLDLLPLGAVLVLCGLVPLARLDARRDRADAVAESAHDQ